MKIAKESLGELACGI